ncbi:MAG: Ni/Fe-hydrogenase 1 b-type cytochrome subunit [Parvularcula sp.]|nr:Ni/Fe-hydrogenase 1 b-type cytochrome subunit [Parvularcula sp.]
MTTDRAAGPAGPSSQAVIWDGAIRLFHWSTVALVALAWWSAENGHMDWHRRFGLTMLGLVTFRLYWGVAGTQTARFSSFVKGPNAIAAYIRKLKRPYSPAPGHNPLGALSVLALIAALVLQVTAGLFAVDVDGLESGPLSHLVSFDQGRAAAEFHETVFNILIALIVLHVAALIFYRVRLQTNLVTAMITGRRANSEPGHDGPFPLVRFIIGVALAGVVVLAVQQI